MKEFDLAVSALTILINRTLKRVVRIYGEQRRLLVKEIRLINRIRRNPRTSQDKRDDLWFQKKLYLIDFRQHLILTAFLMFHSYLEEALALISPNSTPGSGVNRKTGIEKAKTVFSEVLNINIAEFPRWQNLRDFSKLRHLLLHANGNKHLVKDSSDLLPILKRQKQFVFIFKGRIRLKPAILVYFEELLDDFLKWLLKHKRAAEKRMK
jgi:hypothetical protein